MIVLKRTPTLVTMIAAFACCAPADADQLSKFAGHAAAVRTVAVSSDSTMIVTAGADGFCYVLDAQTLKAGKRFGPHAAPLTGAVMLKDRTVITSTLADPDRNYCVNFWDFNTGLRRTQSVTSQAVLTLCIAPDESYLATAEGEEFVRVHGISNRRRSLLRAPDVRFVSNTLCFTANSKTLIIAGGPGFSRWNFQPNPNFPDDDLSTSRSIAGDGDAPANCLVSFPDSKQFISGHTDGVIRVWNLEQAKLASRVTASSEAIRAVAVSPNGELIACGGNDKMLRVYKVGAGDTALAEFKHDAPINSIAFINDNRLVSGGDDRLVRLWSLGKGAPSSSGPSKITETKGSLTPPTTAELAEAVGLVKQVFSAEYASKRPGDKRKLIDKLLQQSAGQTIGEQERFALWHEALRLSSEEGELQIALETAKKMRTTFAMPADFNVQTFTVLGENVSVPKELAELATLALEYAQDAKSSANFALSEQYGRLSLKLATKARAPTLIKSIREFAEVLKRDRGQLEAYEQAMETLKTKPADEAANTTAGRYLCFVIGDWKQGLNYLALGTDQALKDLAIKELASPTEGPAKLALAEQWQTAADSAPMADRPYYLASALYWFSEALPQLAGLQKVKVEQALAKIGKLAVVRK